jgi:hypothetical protein
MANNGYSRLSGPQEHDIREQGCLREQGQKNTCVHDGRGAFVFLKLAMTL